jgi:hypothetical protein
MVKAWVIIHHRGKEDTEYFLFFDFYPLGAGMASGTDIPQLDYG